MVCHPLVPRHRVGPGRTHYGAHQEGEGEGSPGQVLPDGQGAGGRAFLTAEDTPSPSFRPGSSAKTHDLYFQSSGPIEPHREVDWSGWVGLTIPLLADQFQRPPPPSNVPIYFDPTRGTKCVVGVIFEWREAFYSATSDASHNDWP